MEKLLAMLLGGASSVKESNNLLTWIEKIYSFFGVKPSKKREYDYTAAISDRQAEDAYLRQRQLMDDYLTPESQMRSAAAGMDALGLNRMGLVGYTPGSSATTAPMSGTQASPDSSVASSTSSLASLLSSLLESKRIDNETKIADAEVAYKNSKREEQDIVNRWKERRESAQYSNEVSSNALLQANVRKISADAQYQEIMAFYAPDALSASIGKDRADAARARAEVSLTPARFRHLESVVSANKAQVREIDKRILKIREECLNLSAERNLTEHEIEESKSRVFKMEKEIEHIGAQIGLSELDLKYYQFNHSKDISRSRLDAPARQYQSPDGFSGNIGLRYNW